MSIKVIIANDNDILFNSLSDIALQKAEKIEILNVPLDQLNDFIGQLKATENLIILDSITSVTFCRNVLKNAISRFSRTNIIILVIDSSNVTSIINREKSQQFFKRKSLDFQLLDVISLVSDSLKETIELEKNIDDILWKMKFNSYLKGTTYLKDAIFFAYADKKLLSDTQALVKKVAKKNKVLNDKLVRSDIDKVLNNALDLIDIQIIYDVFGNEYDGRKISFRYFIDLCIRFLEKQRYCCFN